MATIREIEAVAIAIAGVMEKRFTWRQLNKEYKDVFRGAAKAALEAAEKVWEKK